MLLFSRIINFTNKRKKRKGLAGNVEGSIAERVKDMWLLKFSIQRKTCMLANDHERSRSSTTPQATTTQQATTNDISTDPTICHFYYITNIHDDILFQDGYNNSLPASSGFVEFHDDDGCLPGTVFYQAPTTVAAVTALFRNSITVDRSF